MNYLTHNEIREKWYSFFESKGHLKMPSASLVPLDDDSLLFNNAGVTPLKKYLDGTKIPESRRIVNIQKCIRTNDIENVGVTKRHLTFFEMMGNFSIGDYFKNEAIEFAYEFLIDYMNIPKEKLYMTVYTHDTETKNKWISLGIDESHLVLLDGNYWEIGEGPSGPDTEIFFDRGEEFGGEEAKEAFFKDEEQERFVEIWNNVFSQYNAKKGVKREDYEELPSKNIDTGAGLERWCLMFQNVNSIFDTDLFQPIIKEIEKISNKKYDNSTPFKVIADHIRCITMALSDKANFGNTGRDYVLRRLLRRSVRMGKKLGINEPFLYRIVNEVVDVMKESYPELEENLPNIQESIYREEKLFKDTLETGFKKLEELIKQANNSNKEIDALDVYRLYDTYGFPIDFTLEYLEEENITTDWFDRVVEEFSAWTNRQEDSVKGHWVGLFNGAKSTAALEEELQSLWGFSTVEDCESLSRLVFMKWVSDVFEEDEQYPITHRWFAKMFQWISHETISVQKTVRLFDQGMKRTEIARLRQLKESTINDHLLKYFLLTKDAFYKRVEESSAAKPYKMLFNDGAYPRYKEAKEQFEAEGKKMDFFLFRYYQIKALKERE